MESSIINPALSLLIKHLVTGQCQKAPNFSVFHWSSHDSLVSTGHIIIMRVVHLLKGTKTSFITKADLITELDQAVWAVHSCNSWFDQKFIWETKPSQNQAFTLNNGKKIAPKKQNVSLMNEPHLEEMVELLPLRVY